MPLSTAEPTRAMPAEEYFAASGLSNSGMKDLAVSPLRYWHLHINPDRPADEPTPAMQFGSAVHCAVLEPDAFLDRYACELVAEDYPGCLTTMEDMRQWLKDHGISPNGTRKAEIAAQVQAVDSSVPIMDVLERQHAAENAGKVVFKAADWKRIHGAAQALLNEPRIQAILAAGQPEVSMFATDPETGVRLKARMDWVTPRLTLDVKTFSQQRGKSIDKSVTDAIWYEGYHKQGYLYSTIRTLQPGVDRRGSGPTARASAIPPFVLAFVESEEPHEVRIRELRPMDGGSVSMLWERARFEVHDLIRCYADCVKRFGLEKSWRYAQEVEPLYDEDIPQLAFSR